uniref:DHC_N2 domain-containing protein n=1 Tax=Heterorhabditis bacteriophora TaxID=37862 RepID=A0A1I7XAM5_HETBA
MTDEISHLFSLPIVLWIQKRRSYVENIRSVILRIKDSSKFGQNLRGIVDANGELTEFSWSDIVRLQPTILEINNMKNPFGQLIRALQYQNSSEQVESFFSRLRMISLNMTDINGHDFLFLLKKLRLLAAFAFSDTNFSNYEWGQIIAELTRLNVRAIEISDNILEVISKADIELLKLSGSPGVKAVDFKKSPSVFVTVKTLIAQDLNFLNDHDAEDFIACIDTKFPRLSTLIWDWNMVDPVVIIDDRSKNIISNLIVLFRYVVLAQNVFIAISELWKTLKEQTNFTLILAGPDFNIRNVISRIYVEERNSIPDLRYLLQLIDPVSLPLSPALVVDFGGFETDVIKKTYENQCEY